MNESDLRHDVEKTIDLYEGITGVPATGTRVKLEREGLIQALSKLAVSADLQKGFQTLRDQDQLEKSFESLIVKHKPLFKPDVVAAAQWRLDNADAL